MSVLIAMSGPLPESDFLRQPFEHIIATDLSAQKLLELSIKVNVVLGDMDSLESSKLAKLSAALPDAHWLHIEDQETTDFEKALLYIKQNKLASANTFITGIFGQDFDHSLYNLQLLAELAPPGSLVYHQDPQMSVPQWGFVVSSSCTVECPANTTLSLIAMQESKISTKGLKWELSDSILGIGMMSCRNINVVNTVHLHLHYGKVVCLAKSLRPVTRLYDGDI